MFKVKQKHTPGQCWAMRCKEVDNGEAEKLCPKHSEEWAEAGCPELAPKSLAISVDTPDVSEVLALASDLKEWTIEDQDEYNSIVEILHDTIDKREALDSQRAEKGKVFYESWNEVNRTFKPALNAHDSLVDLIKNHIVNLRLRFEKEQDEAIANKAEVPSLLEDPPGLTLKPELSVVVQNMDAVPPEYLKLVVDSDAVMAAVGEGVKTIPGLSLSQTYKVFYRRPAKV